MYKILQPVLDILYIPVNMSQCWQAFMYVALSGHILSFI